MKPQIVFSRSAEVIFKYYPGYITFTLPLLNHSIPLIVNTTPFMTGDYVLDINAKIDKDEFYFLGENKPIKVEELIHRFK